MAARRLRSRNTAANARVRSAPRALAASGAALLLIAWQLQVASKVGALFGDFRAFYCASAAVAHGANPYAASSIYACERAAMPFGLYQATPGVAVPAPLPGYALLAFAPLGVLPYVVACALWLLLLTAAVFASARALAILLDRPADVALWAVATGFAVISIPFGELGSPVVAAVLWMAVAVRREAWTWAALAAAVAMILPHVALPAIAGVLLFVPRMRTRIVALAAVLAGLDVLCGGPAVALSYVRDVLPAHAHSEIGSTAQYGMTWILHGLALSDAAAIAGGEVSYVVMTLLGLWAAHALVTQRRDDAYAVLVPPAFAVLGGTFMHYTQIMIAIPAALLLFAHSAGRTRSIFGAAFLLLAFPWLWALGQPVLVLVYAIVSGVLAAWVLQWSASVALRTALAATLLTGIVIAAGYIFGPGLSTHVHGIVNTGALAQSSWEQFVRSQRASTGPPWWIGKAPTWAGLIVFVIACFAQLKRGRLRDGHITAQVDCEAPVLVEQAPITP